MPNPVTYKDIVEMIKGRMEPTEPADTILRVLKENDGKHLDKRFNQKLQHATGDKSVHIVHQYGMVDIVWGPHGDSRSIVIAYTDGCPTIDAAKIKENNPAYFDARDSRNAERRELLSFDCCGLYKHGGLLMRITETINDYIEARDAVQNMLKEDQLQVIRYDIEALLGGVKWGKK